jgi:Asp-tRNA(Asn)/Glu-tRNA(Gln) amidotransferase A subunit family amidase
MPVGLHIVCPRNEDVRSIAIARAFEKHLGTARERLGTPPLGV